MDINTKLVQNIKLVEVATCIGTEYLWEHRLSLIIEERKRMFTIINNGLKRSPTLPNLEKLKIYSY